MEDFTAGATHDQPVRRQASLGPEWDARIHQLVSDWGAEKSPELIEEMIVTGAWWDLVDALATHHLGDVLRSDRARVGRVAGRVGTRDGPGVGAHGI